MKHRPDSYDAVFDALRACGIRGPNLHSLAHSPGVTAAIVREEHDAILNDPNVRNVPAVLFSVLRDRFAVEPTKQSSPISDDVRALSQRIEALRR